MKILILAIFTSLQIIESAKILGIFPTPSLSHQLVFQVLTKDLAARGHELLILSPETFKTDNPNVTQIDLHSSYKVFHEALKPLYAESSSYDENDISNLFFDAVMKFFEDQMSHADVKKLIEDRKNYKFDLIIIEGLMNYPMLAFGEIFNAPIIEFTSMDNMAANHKWMGNEANPVVHPELIFKFQQRRLTFFERWKCLKFFLLKKLSRISQLEVMNKFIKRHFPIENPDIDKMRSRIALMMTNTHPVLGYIRSILPNTIQLGFMHIESPKPLKDQQLKNFLDNSEHGVIYLSFGSNVQWKNLGSKVQEMFLNTFKSLNYDIIWKYESDVLTDIPKNIMMQKWLPQADLLAHPNLKLFITHGGQQSMEESIDRAIPTIVIPLYDDQYSNAERVEKLKIGMHLDIHTLKEDRLTSAIQEMLKPEYKENVQKLKDLIHDQPMTSREKAVWWTEYVIRHKGAKHFYYHGKDVPFYEKFFLDFVAIGLIMSLIFVKFSFMILSKFRRTKNQKRKFE